MEKDAKSIIGKMFNFNLVKIISHYEGKIINNQKEIERIVGMAGKIITISSVKGGVGKTTMTFNLAGIYCELNKRVLIIDLDLYSGGIAASLNV